MENIRIPYKNDVFGNPLFVRVSWANKPFNQARPIALIYHAGGLILGSSEVVPQAQISYLASRGFVVAMPNYRLLPQVTGKEAFADSDDAFEWARNTLPSKMHSDHHIEVDASRIVVLGHSSGATMAMHLATYKPIKAITAFYPFLYASDRSTNGHQPTKEPPFGGMPDYSPTEEDWASISPARRQVSEAPFSMTPGSSVPPRFKWAAQLFKYGKWMATAVPDDDLDAIDPLTRVHADWAPTMIVHGTKDFTPGRSLELMQRAERELQAGGVKEVRLEIVHDEGHMFDHQPAVGTTDLGPKWQAVVTGLDWLIDRA